MGFPHVNGRKKMSLSNLRSEAKTLPAALVSIIVRRNKGDKTTTDLNSAGGMGVQTMVKL